MLTLSLRDGKSVSVGQYYVPDALGNYKLSQSVVAIGARRYRDPALASWLTSGWVSDAASFDVHWTCTSKIPPDGHLNEVSGNRPNGDIWLVASDPARGCVTFYTGHAGRWRSSTVATSLPDGALVEQVQFVAPLDGYILVAGYPGAGQAPHVLFATHDGGMTWKALHTDSDQPFPQNNTLVNMRFTSPTNGWLVTLMNSLSPSRVFVYHTTDGGRTWTESSFPMPSDVQASGCLLATAPVFQSALDGSIQVLSQWNGILYFSTTDGGQHWSFDPLGNG